MSMGGERWKNAHFFKFTRRFLYVNAKECACILRVIWIAVTQISWVWCVFDTSKVVSFFISRKWCFWILFECLCGWILEWFQAEFNISVSHVEGLPEIPVEKKNQVLTENRTFFALFWQSHDTTCIMQGRVQNCHKASTKLETRAYVMQSVNRIANTIYCRGFVHWI